MDIVDSIFTKTGEAVDAGGKAIDTASEKAKQAFEKIVDEAQARVPYELDMDTVVRPCDLNIRPIYPARYAYMNFFGSARNSKAALPSPIYDYIDPEMLSLYPAEGYCIRMPRAGWIYVKEEAPLKTRGSQHKGRLLIFKYGPQVVEVKDGIRGLIVKYTQYERTAGNASWEKIQPANGSAGLGYPFLALNKDVSKISIVYSEVPFSERILDKIDKDESFRRNAMQFVDLDDEKSAYAIDATEEHLEALIEEFKEVEEQFARYHEHLQDLQDPDAPPVNLGDLTTEDTYAMDVDLVMRQMDSVRCPYYKDKAKIVVLHDPVGYQRDILNVHTLLSIWQRSYMATNIYPLTIGQFIEQLEYAVVDNFTLSEQFKDNIHLDNWQTWWPKLIDPIRDVNETQEATVALYRGFFEDLGVADKLGGLTHYFSNFFSVNEKKDDLSEEDAKEFKIFCTLISELLGPLKISDAGMFTLLRVLAGNLSSESSSTWDVVRNGVVNTLGHDGANKDVMAKYLTKGVDQLLNATAEIIAHLFVVGAEKASQISIYAYAGNVEKLNQYFTIKCLSFLGVEMQKGNHVVLDEKSWNQLLKKLEEYKNQGITGKVKGGMSKVNADLKKWGGKKVFNWFKRVDDYTYRLFVKVPTIKFNKPKFKYVVAEHLKVQTSVLFDCSLSGLDLYMKLYTFYSLASQSNFDQNDPLKASSRTLYIRFTYLNTVIGGMVAARNVSELLGKAAARAELLAQKINRPVMGALLGTASRNLLLNSDYVKIIAKRAVVATGFLSGTLAYYDAYHAFSLGNEMEGYSHAAIGTGTFIMTGTFLLTTPAIGGAIGATSAGGAGLASLGGPIFWGGMALAAIGYIGAIMFSKNEFENLLNNCFWGRGNKYAFWNLKRPSDISDQFNTARKMDKDIKKAFLVERQEFLNLFIRPILKKEKNKKGKITYSFLLPNFRLGESELIYNISKSSYGEEGRNHPGYYLTLMGYKKAKERFESLMEDALSNIFDKNKKSGSENQINENGVMTLSLDIEEEHIKYLNLSWYYMPTEDIISPLRYQWGEEPTWENAIYGYNDEKLL
ncbi:hypothetical protein ID858_05055 [Xenorhabdus sp. DI]|uniref:toxin VasX n=1 Tax=Xenorhabdus doucetiae TaxID=351671 RepID=UPI00199B9FC8|nr:MULTISPECIES: toxin VasX [unclassified Xenorhabdus]MBD2784000.1 hypothetical protein [Xenorhabdus sp. 3]MBD2787875.1 hypothetical protein [Xenorhabdus sp. DI]